MKRLHLKLKNNQGFTFVELIMAAGMIGLLGLTITYSDELLKKEAKKSKSQTNRQKVVAMVQKVVSTRNACENTFLGTDPTGTSGTIINQLRDFDNNVIFDISASPVFGAAEAGQAGSTGQIRITEMRLSHYELSSPPQYNNRADEATLTLTMERLGGVGSSSAAQMGNDTIVERIKVRVEAGSGTVTRCYANEGVDLAEVCEMLQGTYSVLPSGEPVCRSIYGMMLGGADTISRPSNNSNAIEFEDNVNVVDTTLVGRRLWIGSTAIGSGVSNFENGDLFAPNSGRIRNNIAVGDDVIPSGRAGTLFLDRGLGVNVLGSSVPNNSLSLTGNITTGRARMYNYNQNTNSIAATVGFLRIKLANLLSDVVSDNISILTDVANAVNSTPTVADSMTRYVCREAAGSRTLDIRNANGSYQVGTYSSSVKDCEIDMTYELTNCQVDAGESRGPSGTAVADCPRLNATSIRIGSGSTQTSWNYLIN